MADLGTLRPSNTGTTYTPTGFTAFDLTVNGGVSLRDDSDGSYNGVAVNTTGQYARAYPFDDTPADFVSMAALAVRLRRAWSAAPNNSTWDLLAVRIMTGDGGTVLAALDSGGGWKTVDSNITATTPADVGPISFDYVNTGASKSDWDNAEIELRIDRTRTKGGDALGQRIHEAWITGTYTATITSSFTADAYFVGEAVSSSYAADAIVQANSGTKSLTADAIAMATTAAAVSADASIMGGATASFTADAVVQASIQASSSADAIIQQNDIGATFTADAIRFRTYEFTGSAPTYVQRIASTVTKAAGATLDLTIPAGGVAAGSSVIVIAYWRNAPTSLTVTDSRSNSYSLDELQADTTGSMGALVYRANNITALQSGDTITLDSGQSGDSTKLAIAIEVSGIAGLDQTAKANGDSTSVDSGLTPQTTFANELILGLANISDGVDISTFTVTGAENWTTITNEGSTGGGTNGQINPFHKTVSATGQYGITGSISPAAVRWAAITLAYLGTPGLAADAVIIATVEASVAADAVIFALVEATFTTDAEIVSAVTTTDSISSDAVLFATTEVGVSADAIIQATESASATADAVLRSTQSTSLQADAVVLVPQAAAVTADAILAATITAGITADGVLRAVVEQALSADASLTLTSEAAITADAVLLAVVEAGIAVDAVIFATTEAAASADAVVQRTGAASATADAIVQATSVAAVAADAVVFAAIELSFSADAYVTAVGMGALTADAVIQETQSNSLSADAELVLTGIPVWTTPADTVAISDTPVLTFLMPTSVGNMHFHMELDTASSFDTGSLRSYKSNHDQTGWEYWNNSVWTPIPATGVPNSFSGNEARYTISSPLAGGTWFRRVRGGTV